MISRPPPLGVGDSETYRHVQRAAWCKPGAWLDSNRQIVKLPGRLLCQRRMA